MVDVGDNSRLQADAVPKLVVLVWGQHPLGAVLHSSDALGQLFQWLHHDDITINIVHVLLLLVGQIIMAGDFYSSTAKSQLAVQQVETAEFKLYNRPENWITLLPSNSKCCGPRHIGTDRIMPKTALYYRMRAATIIHNSDCHLMYTLHFFSIHVLH